LRHRPCRESGGFKGGVHVLTFEQIKELVGLVAQNRLQGLELERSGFRLKIDGQQTSPTVQAVAVPAAAQLAPVQVAMPVTSTASLAAVASEAAPAASAAPAAPAAPPAA